VGKRIDTDAPLIVVIAVRHWFFLFYGSHYRAARAADAFCCCGR